jgi:PIN domain nuclease of toxin-antitoxin system
MRLLLDTHALIWAALMKPELSRTARYAIESRENRVFVSVVSFWEIATKVRIGKMGDPGELLRAPRRAICKMHFRDIQVNLDHAKLGGSLISQHKDPFDRMIAAQALLEGLTLVSVDSAFDSMGVTRLW